VRALTQIIACDIHPLNNLAPLKYIKGALGKEQPAIDAWYHHWILVGFDAVEAQLKPGPYAFGTRVTLADICLVPQVLNGQRLNCDFSAMPTVMRIHEHSMTLDAFQRAAPSAQPDAE